MRTKYSGTARMGLLATLMAAAFLGGCGGGGSSGGTTATPATSAEGSWAGTTNTGRSVSGLVLNDGTYYILYTPANDPTTLAGFVQGTGSSSAGNYTSSNLKDYNLEGLGVNSGSIASSYAAKTSLNGTITYAGGTSTTFTSSYDATYANTPASLASIAGTYAGTVAVPVVGNQTFSLAVSSAGVITSTGNGCTASGTITPRTVGNAYDVTMSFAGASCSLAGNIYTGVADYTATTKLLLIAAPNASRSNGMIFIGTASSASSNPNALVGTVRGPVGAQVVLQNNSADNTSVTVASSTSSPYGETSFAFPTVPANGAAYLVSLLSASSSQTCSVYKGASGTIPVTPTSVRVGCEHTYDLLSRSTDNAVLSYNAVNSGGVLGGNATTGEGRYVAFVSTMAGLTTAATGAKRQVFWRDRQTGQTLLVSATAAGVEGNDNSYSPAISADGQTVAFESYASNLVAGDTNAVRDVFVWSAANPTAGVQRVSVSDVGAQANSASDQPTISGDGKVVAFNTWASNITAGVTGNATTHVVRRDLTTNTNTLVTAGASGSQPMLSEDGNRLAFWSYASNLVVGDTNGLWDIFVYDHAAGSITRVSLTSTGGERNQGTDSVSGIVSPVISGNGRYVAYSTTATNVVPNDTNAKSDVFVVDTQTMVVVRVSVDGAGVQGNGDSPILRDDMTMSYDGTWVAFTTLATNLGPTAYNAVMHNIVTGETRAVTSMTQTYAPSGLSMSRTGAYVSFDTGQPGGLDPRFSSSGMFARFTGVGRAWWWID